MLDNISTLATMLHKGQSPVRPGSTSCRLRFLLDIVSIGGFTSSMTAASPVPLFSTRKVPVWFTDGLPTIMLPMLAFTCGHPQHMQADMHARMQASSWGTRVCMKDPCMCHTFVNRNWSPSLKVTCSTKFICSRECHRSGMRTGKVSWLRNRSAARRSAHVQINRSPPEPDVRLVLCVKAPPPPFRMQRAHWRHAGHLRI